jgi:adenylate cyclase
MKNAPGPALPYDSVTRWLLEQGYRGLDLGELVRGLGQRIVSSGISLHRISIGGMILHPVFGALDVSWEAQSDVVRNEKFPRSGFTDPDFQNSPFFYASESKTQFERYHIESGDLQRSFPIFEKFRAQGVTDYVIAFHHYGDDGKILWADLPSITRGVVLAISTRRIGGFEYSEIEYLRALTLPLCFCVKASMTRDLAQTVLDTYLGAYSGSQVLDGQVERGDSSLINCVLWYCDLRDSTALADKMPLDEFLGMVNDYFECCAGAVLDHGGEVLRFIGDAVIAIFPYNDDARPLYNMVRAAVATAREAISRVDRHNEILKDTARPPIRFGISMHIGAVMYGNIGTERRLEFSVIGPAANEVVRLEGLCKKLNTPVIVSSAFDDVYPEDLIPLGNHPAAGVEGGLTAFTLSEFAP